MSSKRFGEQAETFQLQPGWTIDTDFTTQTLSGQCVFKCEVADSLGNELRIGTKHPKSDKLELISKTVTGSTQGKALVTCQYFGLLNNPTRKVWSFYNATNEEPIESHPDFDTFSGGDFDNATNGAIFDEETDM